MGDGCFITLLGPIPVATNLATVRRPGLMAAIPLHLTGVNLRLQVGVRAVFRQLRFPLKLGPRHPAFADRTLIFRSHRRREMFRP